MDRVRTLRVVFWWAGWVSLAFTVLGMLVTLLSLSSQPRGYGNLPPGSFMQQPLIMTLFGLPYQLVLPIVLFFAWGVLTALGEIHDRLEEEIDLMSEEESRPAAVD